MVKHKLSSGGFTLIEVVVFIVVSSIALVGVLSLYQQAVARSADAIVSRQALEAAYALLEEVQAMPFTYCDLSDPAVATATSAAGCSTPQGLSPIAGKSRGSLSSPFNNVGDYGGYSETGITDINGIAAPGLASYRMAVALSNTSVTGISASDAIRIDITVMGPSGSQVVSGYRIRHSPNATP
jgi:MSHA pilin protein MshD